MSATTVPLPGWVERGRGYPWFWFSLFSVACFYFSFCQPGSRPDSEPIANAPRALPPLMANMPPLTSALPPMASSLSSVSSTIPPGSSTLPLVPAVSNVLAGNAFPHPLTPTLSSSPSPINVSLFFPFFILICLCFYLLKLIQLPLQPTSASSVQAVPWVVNAGDRLRSVFVLFDCCADLVLKPSPFFCFRYKALFEQTDNDKDGFISGVEIKNVFLQTGLPQNILAHIWNLCDMRQVVPIESGLEIDAMFMKLKETSFNQRIEQNFLFRRAS